MLLLFCFLQILLSSNCASAFVCRDMLYCSSLVSNEQRLSTHCDVSSIYNSLPNTDSAAADSDEPPNAIAIEMESLRQQLTFIEALEGRNKAQIDSFIDEQDQWDSMEEHERQLLQSKVKIEKRLEQLTSELVALWIGEKSIEG